MRRRRQLGSRSRLGRAAAASAWLAAYFGAASAAQEPAAANERGLPFLRNYEYRTYDAHPQNWAVLQTSDGRMLFGNTDGVLEYDGVRWPLLQVANGSIVRSLAEDEAGRVYVGAVGELGYLERDENGDLTYVSLVGELPPEARELGDVWLTWAIPDGVFFVTFDKILRWHDGRFVVRQLRSHQFPALVGGRVYNNHPVEGLQVLRGDRFEPVAGGGLVAGVQVFRMLPYDDDTLLIGSRGGELFLFTSPSIGGAPGSEEPRSPSLVPFATGADEELRRHRIYCAAALPDGGFALGTRTGGLLVIDRDGALRFRLDKSTGLRDDSVWAAAVDREGGLWLALNRGLARAEVSSPLTVFGERSGLDGTVEGVTRHDGTLVAATGAGAYLLDSGSFRAIRGLGSPPCWSPVSVRGRLLVGCNAGVFAVEDGRGRLVRPARNVFVLYPPPSRPERVFAGEANGLGVLRFKDGAWVDGGRIEGIPERIRGIAEDGSGRLWLGSQYRGVIRLTFRAGAGGEVAEIRRFGFEDGLPTLESVKVQPWADRAATGRREAGELLFGTEAGLYRFDDRQERFQPAALLRDEVAGRGILRLAPDGPDRLWLSFLLKGGLALASRRDGGSWVLDEETFRRLPGSIFYALRPEPSGVAWIGGVEGLFRYRPTGEPRRDPGFGVTVAATTGGGGLPAAGGIDLAYAENSLSFRFAAQSFHDEAATLYSYRLDGFDADWSSWGTATSKEYTNLNEGRYRFEVRARNLYGSESEASEWAFTIRPPWYRTTWAYLAYLLAAGLFVTAIVRWRARHYEREKSELELEIAARARAEAALRESERKLRLAVEGARMAAWSWDLRTDEVSGAEQIAEVLGLDPESYGGFSGAYREIVHPEDVDRFDRVMSEARHGSGGEYEIEHRILRPDGSVGWVYGKGRVLCDDRGRPRSMTGMTCDVSERKQAETERERLIAELEEQHAELEEQHAELERFNYTVSHDLRTPLVTIKNYAGALRQDAAAGDGKRSEVDIDRICTAADRMHRLLDELLELSRIGRMVNPPQQVPFGELVDEAAELLEARIAERGVELRVAADLPVVEGDRTRLFEIVLNLLENAVKYTGDQAVPRIEVGSLPVDGAAVLYVRDNGRGVDPRYHDKIFELFERLDASEEGTGVGLTLVRRIVQAHGGRIWVESQGLGHGSTFFFTLPAECGS